MKTLIIKRFSHVGLLMIIFILTPWMATAMEPRVSFNEVAQTADLIFTGTVVDQGCRLNDRQTMVFTDVFFDDISILHAAAGAVQKEKSLITLTYAGGFIEGYGVTVSGTPKLETDQRYLIFTRDDGKVYANPIVGGSQGLFRIIEDLETGEEHLLGAGDRAVTGFSGDSITMGSDRVLAIENGKLYTESPSNTVTLESPPISSKPGSSARISNYRDSDAEPLPLFRFIRHLEEKALSAPLGHRVLRQGSEGKFFRRHGQKMEAENLQPASPSSLTTLTEIRQRNHDQPRVPLAGETIEPASRGERRTDSTDDGDLCYCGFQGPYLEIEQVAETSWAFSIQNYAMWSYNELVDLYRYFPDDGGFGINFESEFIGWASDALMDDVYGFNWNGALGVCITWFTWVCSEIVESDIAYNSAYGWTDSPEYSYTHSDAHLLLRTTMHELGHSWGALTGTCDETYSYIHPTVMHRSHPVIEDGNGIHMIDAAIMRYIYPDVVEPSTMDIGVESYYAAGDLNNSTTDQDEYYPGDSITLYNVTTENMTGFALNDVRIRFFLSPDTTITTADYQLGNDAFWNWPIFPENIYGVIDYHTTIPSSVPAGSYYIGAMVSINGFSNDHFTANNITRFKDPINVIVDPPAAPTNVQATDAAYCDRVLVNWDTSAGASEYRVIRNGYSVSDWQSGTTFEDDSAVAGWVYSYTVKAGNSAGESDYSAADAGSINTVPSGPTGVSASDGTYDYGVRITWNEVENAEDYHVIRDMALLSDWIPGTEFIDTTAEPGVVYIYNVWSRNACGEGGFSSPDEGYAPVESTGIFASPVGYPTGDGSRCVAIGDLDGDGSADLIAANYSSDDVSVILGLGDGTFSTATNYPAGTAPASVAIGDLNNDGALDLVSANQGDDSVAVLLGNGDGSFSAAQFFPVGDEPWSVVLADLNGDTLPDAAVTNSGSNSVSVLLGLGNGTLASAVSHLVGTEPMGIAAGDLDGDTVPDLAVTNKMTDNVSVLLGHGNGTFSAAVSYAAGTRPHGLAIGDMDGDTIPDLVTANSGTDTVSVLPGLGGGTFAAAVEYWVGAFPTSVNINDLNGDALPDLVVTNYNAGTITLLTGTGDGSLFFEADYPVGNEPAWVASGFLDANYSPDLAVVKNGDGDISVLLNRNVFPAPSTISATYNCTPSTGTVPFTTSMLVQMVNLEPTRPATRVAARIDVILANGTSYSNWRQGYTNVSQGSQYSLSWGQTLPVIGSVIGNNIFTMSAEDVTPSPYNQPPYPPAGDTAMEMCVVTANAP